MPLPDAYAGPQTNSAFICDLFATKMSRQQVVGVLRDERRPENGVRDEARRATDLRLVIGSPKAHAREELVRLDQGGTAQIAHLAISCQASNLTNEKKMHGDVGRLVASSKMAASSHR